MVRSDPPATIAIVALGAGTGTVGGGKIFVLDMEQCVQLRTGDSGPAAIG